MAIEKPTWIYKSKGDKQTASEMNQLAQSVIANAIELSNVKDDVAELSNKTYILRKNMVSGVNVLTQEMIDQENTIYEIRYDFTLDEDITIPANCVIKFEGGSISGNHTLTGQDTKIINSSNSYIFKLTSIVEINIEKLPLSWCGGVADYDETNNTGTDNSTYLLKALTLASANGNIPVLIDGNYFCATQINISVPLSLQGNYTAKVGKPTGSGYNSRIVVSPNITLFNITGYNEYWYQIDLRNVAFKGTNKSSKLVTSSVSMGPARPHRIESCEARDFYRVFEFIVPLGKETNFFNAAIFGNVFVQNYEVIYSIGKDAIGNIHIFDNVIEHNGLDINNNITSNGVLCLSSQGSCIIENNLLEGQPNAINISFIGAQIKITDNYFEGNTGDYIIQINQSERLQSHATIMRNRYYNVSPRINVYTEYGYLELDSDVLTNKYLYVKNVTFTNISNLLASHIESSLTIPVDTALVGNNPSCIAPTGFVPDLPGRKVTRSGIDCFKCNYSDPSTVYVTYNNLNIKAGKVIFLMVYAQRGDDLDGTNPITIHVNNEYYTEFGQYSLAQKKIWLCRITKNVVIDKIEIISNNQGIISPIGFYVDFPESVLNMRIPKFEDWFAPYFIQHGETAARPPLLADYTSLWNGWKFFDDTLGKPIWWKDTRWVDATGTAV